jgi:hypothetical protein
MYGNTTLFLRVGSISWSIGARQTIPFHPSILISAGLRAGVPMWTEYSQTKIRYVPSLHPGSTQIYQIQYLNQSRRYPLWLRIPATLVPIDTLSSSIDLSSSHRDGSLPRSMIVLSANIFQSPSGSLTIEYNKCVSPSRRRRPLPR